jgi:hypothetical protein
MSERGEERREKKRGTWELDNFDREVNGKQVRVRTIAGDVEEGRAFCSKYFVKIVKGSKVSYIPKSAISILEIQERSEVKI